MVELTEEELATHTLVMTSFLVTDKGRVEKGCTILWRSLDQMLAYLDTVRRGEDDRPFEHRWDHLVAEYVPYGVYGHNILVGWWKATLREEERGYDIVQLDKAPAPYDIPRVRLHNFTISG